MNIAICDDELKQQEIFDFLIKKYKAARPNIEIKLSIFSSGDEMLAYIEEHGSYDLYVLDIIMPRSNGIQIGLTLRNKNDIGLIIYLTSSPDFAVDSYQTQAFYYLLKPLSETQVFEVLDKAYEQIETQNVSGITIKTSGGIMRLLPLKSILYAELKGRAVRYYLVSGEMVDGVTFRSSFQNEVAPLLSHDTFTLCGSSFAVNLRYVNEVGKSDIILSNGSLVPISRNLYSAFKKRWMLYWLERR